MIDKLLIGYTLAACLVGLYLTAPEQSEPENQRAQYCEMVQAWHETGGAIGWPPYDGECDDE